MDEIRNIIAAVRSLEHGFKQAISAKQSEWDAKQSEWDAKEKAYKLQIAELEKLIKEKNGQT